MKNVDSKLLLGLVVGAAVGAAVGYLAATDKREELLDDLKEVATAVHEAGIDFLLWFEPERLQLSCGKSQRGRFQRQSRRDNRRSS